MISVFPTHVGVYRLDPQADQWEIRIPHACGGVPFIDVLAAIDNAYSPRMWGCTAERRNKAMVEDVFPTHVGVYRYTEQIAENEERIPHACGGVPGFGKNIFLAK